MRMPRRPQKRTVERRRQRPQSLVAIDPLVGPGNPSHRHPPCAKTDQSRPRHCLVRLATRTSSQRSKSSYQTEYATVMLGEDRTGISRKGRTGRAVTCGRASRTIADRRGVASARGTLLALIWAVEMKLPYIVLS